MTLCIVDLVKNRNRPQIVVLLFIFFSPRHFWSVKNRNRPIYIVVFYKLRISADSVENNYGDYGKTFHVDAVTSILAEKLELQSNENMDRGPPLKL